MGTPVFAVPSLERLVSEGYQVVAVITAPDKPSGRGRKVNISPVKAFALNNEIPVLQPTNLKNEAFIKQLTDLKPDLQIVVAFRMLPEAVWDLPPLGTFNLHASLLPQYRGAAPINWAIINGEKQTGLSTFFLKKNMDTGNIIFQKQMEIGPDENAGELHDRMMIQGAELVIKTTITILSDYPNLTTYEQKTADIKLIPAPKIFKKDCLINWNQPSQQIHNLIRGLSPYPGAFSTFISPDGKKHQFKIFRSKISHKDRLVSPGEIITDGKTYLNISTQDRELSVIEIQLEGKRKLHIQDFLRGYSITNEWSLP